LHHNLDKSLLIAGQVQKCCGGGRVIRPMELVMGDRATDQFGTTPIPVQEIAIATAKQWFRNHLPHVDPERHIRFRPVMAPGSTELTDIFTRGGAVLVANDTSGAAGHSPYTPLERLVLDLEAYLNGSPFKTTFPDTGQDVKIMATRIDGQVEVIVAMPFLAPLLSNVASYFARKREVETHIRDFLQHAIRCDEMHITLNSLDREDRGEGGVYLSLTGTSAEDADSGQVGRGNRVSGVIAFHRPAGAEAAAGKNPVSHVGKIYNVLAHQLAQEIIATIDGVEAVSLWILSQIGQPIDSPRLVQVQLTPTDAGLSPSILRLVEDLIQERFAHINEFCRALAHGRYPVC
jgi:S-adenosylmethionine synthetase